MTSPARDPVLIRFRHALDAAFGDRIERVVLFGSRARGDARPDSDYDIALFLNGMTNTWPEVRRLVDIQQRFWDETGADIRTMPWPAGSWRDQKSPLMWEIRKDGIDLGDDVRRPWDMGGDPPEPAGPMKLNTESFLEAANDASQKGRRILAVDIPDQAARLAYYAMFHAAQALIFERTDKVSKTHHGVQRQFHDLARREPADVANLAGGLSTAYPLKEWADYRTGRATPVTVAEARAALDRADAFVAAVTAALQPPT